MKIAIMQPYFFPYLGYFQLINAVDIFISYDDVNYIKGGWINRNNLLIQGKPNLFTISLEDSSSFSLISQTKIDIKKFSVFKKKFLKTITQSYKRAPYYNDVFPLLENFFDSNNKTFISDIAYDSLILISNYLKLNTKFQKSSIQYADSKGLDRTERLITIIKKNKAQDYINPIGGQDIYDKDYFKLKGIKLHFLQSIKVNYIQLDNDFVPWLSIIDVIMFNSKEEVGHLLNKYTLV
ncbi:WbqC family protein [Mesoflavibacter zeaxanthinifaciens]|uniref:WbqC family protein n=1 Tax=Mesoflavibacter zeaxanthinifaciens TaxID=393060 RepID=UPI003A94793C